jgi:hypothetical protein
VSISAVKALNKGVLLGFTELDKPPFYPFFGAPAVKDGGA